MTKREKHSAEVRQAHAELITQYIESGEEFRDIKGYEGKYKIGGNGHIISYIRSYPCVIKPWLDSKGRYYMITLPNDQNKRHRELVHRLVAEAFIDNPLNFPEVNHKDSNTHNNKATNLEWCTSAYNMAHSYSNMPPDRNRRSCILVFPDGSQMKFESYADVQRYREKYNLPFGKYALDYYGKSKGFKLIKLNKTPNTNRNGLKIDLPEDEKCDRMKSYEELCSLPLAQ